MADIIPLLRPAPAPDARQVALLSIEAAFEAVKRAGTEPHPLNRAALLDEAADELENALAAISTLRTPGAA